MANKYSRKGRYSSSAYKLVSIQVEHPDLFEINSMVKLSARENKKGDKKYGVKGIKQRINPLSGAFNIKLKKSSPVHAFGGSIININNNTHIITVKAKVLSPEAILPGKQLLIKSIENAPVSGKVAKITSTGAGTGSIGPLLPEK